MEDQEKYIKTYRWMHCIKGGVQRDIYAFLHGYGGSKDGASCSIKSIADNAGYNEQQVARGLAELRNQGLVEVDFYDGKVSVYHTIPPSKVTPLKNDTPLKSEGSTPLKNDPPKYNNYIINERDKKTRAREVKTANFKKPTIEEITAYCDARANGIIGEEFYNFYESKGWMVGKSPMKNWQAAVRTWEIKHKKENQYGINTTTAAAAQSGAAQGKPYSGVQKLANAKFNLD